jgi:hypothetical protein
MTDPERPLDADRDPVLAAALRRLLEPGDEAAFVARVLAGLDRPPAGSSLFDLLAAWARRGIPAALALAVLVAFLVGLQERPAATLEDALVGGEIGVTALLFTSGEPPEAGILLAAPTEP